MSLPDQHSFHIPAGHIWLITEGGSGLGNALASKLQAQGQPTLVLQFPQLSPPTNSTTIAQAIPMISLTATSEDYLQQTIANIVSQYGPIAGLIHTHPLPGAISDPEEFFPEAELAIAQAVYFLTKQLKSSLNQGYVVMVSQVDGQLATTGQPVSGVIGAGLAGFVKALHREWPKARCRFLDLDPGLTLEAASTMVLTEIADPQTDLVEVGRNQTERMTLTLEPVSAVFDRPSAPTRDSVFLVSGGGRGITADCVLALAAAYQCRFILLGRTPLDAEEPAWALNCTDESLLRQRLLEYVTGTGKTLTPVAINKLLHTLKAGREIRQTLAQVQEYGGAASYHCVDITQKANLVAAWPDIIAKFGAITGIIHGAGNLADKRLEKKTLADWQQVFDSKIIGLNHILALVDLSQLRSLILFSSVASYFGNAGQTDYALANEILNKFAYACQSRLPQVQVTAINWGPWQRGMMNRALQEYYQSQGIDLIPVAVGQQFLQAELALSVANRAQQVMIGGSLNIPSHYSTQQQKTDTCYRRITSVDNPFLQDHRVGEQAVLPLTCALNWMVKSGEDQLPNYKARIIENFQVCKGIRLSDGDELTCLSHLSPVNLDKDLFSYQVNINSIATDSSLELPHYQGTISLGSQWETPPIYPFNPVTTTDQKIGDLYGSQGCLFHGPSFQGVQKVIAITPEKITSYCRLSALTPAQQGQFTVNSFNPYLADVQLHNVLLWTYHYFKQGCLPTKVAKIEQFQPLHFGQEFYVSTEIIASNKFQIIVDIYVHDQQGNIFVKWQQAAFTIMKKLTTLFWEKEG